MSRDTIAAHLADAQASINKALADLAALPECPPVEPPPADPPPVNPPTTGATWYAAPLAQPTAPAGYPLRVVLADLAAKTPAVIYVYQAGKSGAWWKWPDSNQFKKIKQVGSTLWLEDPNPGVPVLAVGVEIGYTDGTTQKWETTYWDGTGADWPVVGSGSIRCPVASIMQHAGSPPVTSTYAHLIRGVEPGKDFEAVTLDIGNLAENAPDGLEVRYTAAGVPITPWRSAKSPRVSVSIDAPELAGFPDGQRRLSFELRGPGRIMFLPYPAQLHLTRGSAAMLDNTPVYDDFYITMEPNGTPAVPGVGIVKYADLDHPGRPMAMRFAPFTLTPKDAAWGREMWASSLTPSSKLFESVPMQWDRRDASHGSPTWYIRSWPPKHDEAPASLNPQFPNSVMQPPHRTHPSRGGCYGPRSWLSNYAQFAGVKGHGWVTSDPTGNVCYVARDGKITVLAGYEVADTKTPMWPFAGKSVEKIRENMIARGAGLPTAGLGTLCDVAVDPMNPRRIVVPDFTGHCLWEITHDPANPEARGVVTLLAGKPGVKGRSDGAATDARFDSPISCAFNPDGTAIIIADQRNDRIAVLRNGVVTTIRATPELRAKYPTTTEPWTIRAGEKMTGAGYAILSPQFVRVNRKGEIVLMDQGTGTIRAINGANEARMIVGDGNYAWGKGGWAAFDLDAAGNLYVVNFTGSVIDDSSGTRRSGPLNESIQYIPDDGSGRQYPVFTRWRDFNFTLAETVGGGILSQCVSPHYPWGCWVHPDGALAVNGAGTHGTLIVTPRHGRTHPAPDAYSYELFRKGRNGITPPMFVFGPGAAWLHPTVTDAQIQSRYVDWGKLTPGEAKQLLGTIRFFHSA